MQFDRDNGRLIAIFDGQRREMPDGPWHDEPDRVDFEHAGFPCLLLRGPGGSWCGYVGTPPGHPWHGRDFAAYCDGMPDISVHGGVTYSAECAGHICHMPKPGEPDHVWWQGFDCGHSGDLRPGDLALEGWFRGQHSGAFDRAWWAIHDAYRTVEYVRRETAALAEQAREAAAMLRNGEIR